MWRLRKLWHIHEDLLSLGIKRDEMAQGRGGQEAGVVGVTPPLAGHLSDGAATSVFLPLHPRSQHRAWPRGAAQGVFAEGMSE